MIECMMFCLKFGMSVLFTGLWIGALYVVWIM